MKETYRNVLACTAIIPTRGMRKCVLLKCLPIENVEEVVDNLIEEGMLYEESAKIAVCKDVVSAVTLLDDECPRICLSFLEQLLYEMQASPCVEQDRDYIAIVHTFNNACDRLCGRSKESDTQLAELSASLLYLLDEPFFHFVTKTTPLDNKALVSVLCAAEMSLALKVLDRTYEENTAARKLKLFQFVRSSLKNISRIHHEYLGVDDSTPYIDELIEQVRLRIDHWKFILEVEELVQNAKDCKSSVE